VDKKDKFNSFCEDRGCIDKIRMKREDTNNINIHEISKSQVYQKGQLLQDDRENNWDKFSKPVSLLI